MDLWFEWEENNEERFSFEDSDRFEEDSLGSWISDPESISANWRGWKRNSQIGSTSSYENEARVDSLIELCAKKVAKCIPFETVEHTYPQTSEQIQLRIAFWSFPQVEDDIRLYSCLANGSPEEFLKGEHLVKAKAVRDVLQIGFHLSGTINQQHSPIQTKGMFNVAVTFDRGHITSCYCTCSPSATWCAHIIALCLFRIYYPDQVCLRAPVSEYLSRLCRDQLQKFAQYLISELPQQILPIAQRLLDELLSSQESTINTMCGAPDPTAGPAATDQSRWCLDEKALQESVRKMLVRFCGPGPLNDVNAFYMSNTAPPTAAEWSNLLRPLKGREPEGMWNLLYIVRELFHRSDSNAVSLLSTLTEECLANDQVVIWWFDSRSQASSSSAHRNHGNGYRNNTNAASTEATKHACAGFCDELVVLWRLAALNPKLSNQERAELKLRLEAWHQNAVDKARAGHGAGFEAAVSCFPGFLPAIEGCSLDWSNVNLSSDNEKPNTEMSAEVQTVTLTCGGEQLPLLDAKQTLPTCLSVCSGSTSDEQNLVCSLTCIPEERSAEPEIMKKDTEFPDVTPVPLHKINEDLEDLCTRAEALHVHGYPDKARKLAVKLAETILSSETQLDMNTAKNKNAKPLSFSSTTLVKAAFLCGVLAEDPHCHHLAFRVGIFGLEMPRQPAKSKALEVKLANQESELFALLKKLPLRQEEMMVVREKANLICQGKLQRGGAILPIMLATFIFEVLCCPNSPKKDGTTVDQGKKLDEEIGYKAAVCALGMKPNVLETTYPILCEGIRRQRGDLAIALLDYCKDVPSRLKEVKAVLLDKSRYEGPSFVSEAERHNDASHNDSYKKKSDDTNSGPRYRGGFGVPSRRGSSQSSSNTSDSGTDNSSRGSSGHSRPRGRGAGGKSQSKVTVTVNEVRRNEESGSSSGVDTDSAVNHGSASRESSAPHIISAQVVAVCHPGPRGSSNAGSSRRNHASAACGSNSPAHHASGFRNNSKECDVDRKHKTFSQEGALDTSRTVNPQRTTGRPTSDLDGSDIEEDIDEPTSESGGVSLPPDNNITAKLVSKITIPVSRNPSESHPSRDNESRHAHCRSKEQDDDGFSGSPSRSSPSDLSSSNTSSSSSFGVQKKSTDTSGAVVDVRSLSTCSSKTNQNDGIIGNAGMLPTATVKDSTALEKEAVVSQDLTSNTEEVAIDQNGSPPCEVGASASQDSTSQAYPKVETSVTSSSLTQASSNKTEASGVEVEASCSVSSATGSPAEGAASSNMEAAAAVALPAAESAARVSVDDTDGNQGRNRRQGRKKNRKKKGKKSAVNQATEAEAHFMFELAKRVLSKAGGNSSTSVFSQPSTSTNHAGPHRGLQLCAFEMGLFALGLHNRTSVNWLSRTYSSHVSWISGQAMEIGSTAIQLLIERWESNLTPSEVASIADRASRSNDPAMVRAAAELGLSCLHMAHTLNPGEIQRGLLQCRDEDTQLLDRACQAVESAARGGGVYPEVLFDVARHWHYLHEQSQAATPRSHKEGSRNRGPQSARTQQQPAPSTQPPTINPFQAPLGGHPSFNSLPPPPYQTPEQYVQLQMHHQVHQIMNQGCYPGGASYRPSNQVNYGYPFISRQHHSNQYDISSGSGGLPPPYQTASPAVCQFSSRSFNQQQGVPVSYYLNNAYRVGMLALESLARRSPDDRPTVKYSRSPPCSDDIRWLCSLSARLGTSYLHRFCVSALNAVVSPFVLHDLALEAARHLARSNPAQLAINLRSPNINPLVQKSLSMYGQCIHHHLMVMAQSDHEDFVELLRHARGAFCMVPGGMNQFNELLQSIRRMYPKKKDLWQKIMTGLAKA
ncbi:zinc finger SWIM domain-containing protein 8-like isoform X2 [Actinia tenebrosa]|uniref:Zinc finger SWIM domain-containing protein 8-like isoform X2 n=1 Tax=Actinia tenebrosa TaxID=6105 RepID=A0A6P8HDP9_ACTTE|nr:zinc finger SWIM domain-containing protein 8-like isoform X2 [Actinia tenebrosa]